MQLSSVCLIIKIQAPRKRQANVADKYGGTDHVTGNAESGCQNPLTCIRDAYTLASPEETSANEVDGLMIKHFLNTLAEVALSVASRSLQHREEGEVTG